MKPTKGTAFVGQAPSQSGDHSTPLCGRVGERLAALAGLTPKEFTGFRRVNLNLEWLGKNGRGDWFDSEIGRRRAAEITPSLPEKVVLLGRQVARCFAVKRNFLETYEFNYRLFLLLPHPSTLNRWWNNPTNERAAAEALRKFLRG